MLKILSYVKKYWYGALLAPLLMFLEVFMDMLLPKQMALMVDVAIPSGNIEAIVMIGLKMLLFAFIGLLGGVFSGVFTNYTGYKFANDLRKDLFEKIMNLSVIEATDFQTGSLITRVTNDVTQIQNFVSMALRMFVRALSLFVLGIIFTITINPIFGIVIAIALPIEVLILILFMKKVFPHFGRIQEELDEVNVVVHENVGGSRVVKAFSKEEYENERFISANDKYTNTLLTISKYSAVLMPLLTLIVYVAQVAIYYIGGSRIVNFYNNLELNLDITIGEISAATTYITMICNSLINLGMIFTNMGRAMISVKRVNEIMDSKLEIIDGNLEEVNTSLKGTIEYKNVVFGYPKSQSNVLDGISFKVNQGETVAIVGATGCGKSTLVNLMIRLYDVCSGEVLINGINVKDYELVTLRDKIAIVLQKSELFASSIADNIRWGKPLATMEEVIEAAKIAQAHDFILEKPLAYDEVVEQKGTSLSGGQKQRVSIARAIIKQPEILIFDDSTSALDLLTESKLYKALNQKLAKTTKIVVAQRIATAKNADKIIVLDNAKIVAFDTHENLMKTSPIYQDIYNSQLKREGEDDE